MTKNKINFFSRKLPLASILALTGVLLTGNSYQSTPQPNERMPQFTNGNGSLSVAGIIGSIISTLIYCAFCAFICWAGRQCLNKGGAYNRRRRGGKRGMFGSKSRGRSRTSSRRSHKSRGRGFGKHKKHMYSHQGDASTIGGQSFMDR